MTARLRAQPGSFEDLWGNPCEACGRKLSSEIDGQTDRQVISQVSSSLHPSQLTLLGCWRVRWLSLYGAHFWQELSKLQALIPSDPAIPLLRIHPLYPEIFNVRYNLLQPGLIVKARDWGYPKHPLAGDWFK